MAQWKQTGLKNRNITSFAVSGNYLFAGSDSGVYRSTDNGLNWVAVNTGLTNLKISCIMVDGNNLYLGTGNVNESGEGIFKSSNLGTNWTAVNYGLPPTMLNRISSLHSYGGKLFAGGSCLGISTDSGSSWKVDTTYIFIENIFTSGKNLFVGAYIIGGYPYKAFCSKDSGQTWSTVNQLNIFDLKDFNGNCFSFVVDGCNIYGIGVGSCLGVTEYFIVQSTDNGENWKTNFGLGAILYYFTTLAIVQKSDGGPYLFAGRSDASWYDDKRELGAIVLSTNHGMSWSVVDSGLKAFVTYTLVAKGNYLFAGTDSGIWRRPLSEMITDVKQSSSRLPEKYSLSQNYPNPFNPTTTITYSIPERSTVRVSIFNTLGQIISEIVNETKDAGSFEHSFNASQLSSGMYFYRIEAISTQNAGKTFVETKKMILMR